LTSQGYNEGMSKQTDAIIIGAGLAGLMCAYELVLKGKSVVIVHKGTTSDTSSSYAQGGVAVAWSLEDSIEAHVADTLMAGDGLCDVSVVQTICAGAYSLIERLIALGVPFDQTVDHEYRLAKEGAHSYPRIFHVKDHTGRSIIQIMMHHLMTHSQVTWYNNSLQGLLQDPITKRIVGVRVNDESLFSGATVMASGGFSHVFSTSTNPPTTMGEGLALAYMAGADLGDLEFIQFHPTVCCVPGHPPLLISEALRGEGAFLVNAANHAFMADAHPLKDLAPRDVVSRAIHRESMAYLDISPLRTMMTERFPTISLALKHRGFTENDERIPIRPLVHYTVGGIVANTDGETSLPGLYAIGECAVTGLHGANRLASNSLLEAGVMGQHCAKKMSCSASVFFDSETDLIDLPEMIDSHRAWLGGQCRSALGVIRHSDDLSHGIQWVSNHSVGRHPMGQLVVAIMTSALRRCESRGGHYRSDQPNTHAVACHGIISKQGGWSATSQFRI
jgi:L-aspartate oxidase